MKVKKVLIDANGRLHLQRGASNFVVLCPHKSMDRDLSCSDECALFAEPEYLAEYPSDKRVKLSLCQRDIICHLDDFCDARKKEV